MVAEVRAEGPTLVVDAGDFAWKTARLSTERLAQQRRKAELQLRSFALSGIDGVTPGDSDLALGPRWLAATAGKHGVPMLSANLSCGDQASFAAGRRVEIGETTVGLVGVMGTDAELSAPCTAAAPIPAVKRALDELGDVDLRIVLSHQTADADEALARELPEIDLIVSGGAQASFSDPRPLPGQAFQLASGTRGKKLGIARLTVTQGAVGFDTASATEEMEKKLKRYRGRIARAEKKSSDEREKIRQQAEREIRYYTGQIAELEAELAKADTRQDGPHHALENELRGLGTDVADHAETADLVSAAKDDIAALEHELAKQVTTISADSPFLGSARCAGCHPTQTAQWRTTAHAHAWQTLVDDKRQLDLDCYSCHVTGAFHPQGVTHPTAAGELKNVGCEACHGPAKGHPSQAGVVTKSPDAAVCTQCHDGDRDEGRFSFDDYIMRVRH